jgi:hypothetical protein
LSTPAGAQPSRRTIGKWTFVRPKRYEEGAVEVEEVEVEEEEDAGRGSKRAYVTMEEAASAYDRATRAHKGEKAHLNCPTKKEQAAEEAKQQRWIKCGEAGSKYRGVHWDKSEKKWQARIRYGSKQHSLGYFEDENEAARAYDRAARAHHGEKAQLNFPGEGENGPRKSSKYRGVNWHKGNNKWRAQIMNDGKQHHLGSFEDEEKAARAYDRAASNVARAHHGEKAQLNFPAKQRD